MPILKRILRGWRTFVEIGLFSSFFKTEANEYIASRSKERTIEICFLREGQEEHAPLEESAGRSKNPERSMELLFLHQNTLF